MNWSRLLETTAEQLSKDYYQQFEFSHNYNENKDNP